MADRLVDRAQPTLEQLGLAEAGHPGAGVLQGEHQAAAGLALAALDLVVVVSPMSIAGRGIRLTSDQPARTWARSRLVNAARAAGLGAAVVLLLVRAPFLVVVFGAALVAALVRQL